MIWLILLILGLVALIWGIVAGSLLWVLVGAVLLVVAMATGGHHYHRW